jgi:hypothetical protein
MLQKHHDDTWSQQSSGRERFLGAIQKGWRPSIGRAVAWTATAFSSELAAANTNRRSAAKFDSWDIKGLDFAKLPNSPSPSRVSKGLVRRWQGCTAVIAPSMTPRGGEQRQFTMGRRRAKENACHAATRHLQRFDPFALKRGAFEVNVRGRANPSDDDLCSGDATSEARRRPSWN